MPKKQKILLAAAGGILLLGTILTANFSTLKKQLQNIPFFRQPTPTPSKYANYSIPVPLPTGKQVYSVSRGSGSTGPNISQVTIDNFDPKKGEVQTFSVKVQNISTVVELQLAVTTDYKVKTYKAKLTEGKPTDGVWKAIVPTVDSHDYVYRVTIEAQDVNKEKSSVTLTIR